MGANGENPARLADTPSGPRFAGHAGLSNCSDLSWSPDGRWLTYLRKLGDTDALVLEARSPVDGRTTTLLEDPDLRGYRWLSSTEVVLDRWEAPDRPFSNLWHIDVDPEKMRAQGRPRRLTNWAGFAIEKKSMSVSRDARVLAFAKRTDRSDIFIAELADHGDSLGQVRRISGEERVGGRAAGAAIANGCSSNPIVWRAWVFSGSTLIQRARNQSLQAKRITEGHC